MRVDHGQWVLSLFVSFSLSCKITHVLVEMLWNWLKEDESEMLQVPKDKLEDLCCCPQQKYQHLTSCRMLPLGPGGSSRWRRRICIPEAGAGEFLSWPCFPMWGWVKKTKKTWKMDESGRLMKIYSSIPQHSPAIRVLHIKTQGLRGFPRLPCHGHDVFLLSWT